MTRHSSVRVAFDARILQTSDANRGIGNYTRGLLDELLQNSASYNLDLVILTDRERPAPAIPSLGKAYDLVPIASPGKQSWFGAAADAKALSEAAHEVSAQILHIASPLHGPFNWRAYPHGATVATVYDLIPLQYPKDYLAQWPYLMRRLYKRRIKGLKALSALFAISDTVADDVARLVGIPREIISTAYPAVRPELTEHLRFIERARGNHILTFGSLNPSKNTESILRAFQFLSSEFPEYRLLLVAPSNPEWLAWIIPKLRELNISHAVDMPGLVSDEMMAQFYAQAALVVVPSIAEGFGLHALEAMAADAPLAVSDIAVLHEVAGDAAHYFDPNIPQHIAKVAKEMLQSPDALERSSRNGSIRVSNFSWAKSASVVAQKYHEIA